MQQIAFYGHDTAENILWHPKENALYWLDIPTGKLFRGEFTGLEELENFSSSCILELDEPVGGFVFCKSSMDARVSFLLFASEGRIYQWQYPKNGRPELFAQVDSSLVPMRFNDVFALPGSHFVLCGTMPSDGSSDSRLLRFDVAQQQVQVVQEGLKLANGMALSPAGDVLYFADTRDFVVYRYEVRNLRHGEIDWSSRRSLIDFCHRPGRPDGLCIDRQGHIWLAETGAGTVTCFNSLGHELGSIQVGTPKVTSCCFGGTKGQVLFASTQGGTAEKAVEKPGGIFALNKISPVLASDRDTVPQQAKFCGQAEAVIQYK